MAIENLTDVPTEIIFEVGKIALWMQTIGIIVILWIIFNIITLIVNRKKRKTLYSIQNDLKRIESKINKINKKK